MNRWMLSLFAGVSLMTLPVAAQDVVLIDYADAPMDLADPRQWTEIANAIGGDVTVTGEVSGSFTEAGTEQTAYLVGNGTAAAAEPFPELNQRIVVFEDGAEVADWTLPEVSAYSRPITALDVDGDGISEILFEGSFYNMGTLSLGVDLVSVGETPEVIQTLPEMYVDSCETGDGAGTIIANRISVAGGQLVAVPTTLPCG